jgi:hypothetical protein
MQAIDNMGVDAMFKSSVLNILRAKYSKQRFWVAGGGGGYLHARDPAAGG